MKILRDLGPAKLHGAEVALVRDATDTLLFAERHDPSAFDAITTVERLMRDLVESGRWSAESAQLLSDDVAACGPAMALV